MANISAAERNSFFQSIYAADRRRHQAKSTNASFLQPVTTDLNDHSLKSRQSAYNTLYQQKTNLAFHLAQLHQLDRRLFRYLNNAQKKLLIAELTDTRDLIGRALFKSSAEKNKTAVKAYQQDATLCDDYLACLNGENAYAIPELSIPTLANESGPVWLFNTIVNPFRRALDRVKNELNDLENNPVDKPLNAMNQINNLRLYWVWGNSLLDVLFTLCKEFDVINVDIFHKLEDELTWPAPLTGHLSWSLYYLRLMLRLYVSLRPLIHDVIEKEDEEDGVSLEQRLIDSFDQQKLGILNDLCWGTVNLLCFAVLTYRKNAKLGYYGDLLTAGFLIMDLILTIVETVETYKKHHQQLNSLKEDIESLQALIHQSELAAEKSMLTQRLQFAQQRMDDYLFDMQFTKLELANNLIYATLLMLSFPLLIGMVAVPASLPVAAAIILSGAVACFAVTVMFQAVNNFIPVYKAFAQRSRLQTHRQALMQTLSQTDDPDQQKILAIQIDNLQQSIDQQKKAIAFESVLFMHALLVDTLFPVFVFAALFTAPTGLGIGLILAGLALIAGSKFAMNQFRPAQAEKDETELSDDDLSERVRDLWEEATAKSASVGYLTQSDYRFKLLPQEEGNRKLSRDDDDIGVSLACPA